MSFLTDVQQFENSRLHWAEQIRLAGEASGRQIEVSSWLDCPFRVITDDVCTNVYSAIAKQSRRGVSIIQWLPEVEGDALEAWIDSFGDPAYPDEHVEYLRINCKLTPSTSSKVQLLTKAWLFDEMPREYVVNQLEG